MLPSKATIVVLEEAEDILFRQGDASNEFFVLLCGRLSCVVSTDNEGESASEIYASSRVKTKKQFSTKRAMKNKKKKKTVIHGQRVGGHTRERDLHGVVVGVFDRPGQGFGETALTKTVHGLHRRASILAETPSILLCIRTSEYIKVQRKWKSLKLKIVANFLCRLEFLRHWPREKINNLAENACSLIVYRKNQIVQKKHDPILYCYITVKGALRKMQKLKHNNMIIETKKAYKGDVLCCNEFMHHVTHSTFGIVSAAEYFTTEVIRLNQNGYLMIQKDEIAFNKLRHIVRAEEFLKYYRITEKRKIIDNQNVLVRHAHLTSTFEIENKKLKEWNNFRANLSSTLQCIPSHDEQIELKLKIARKHSEVNSYLKKKMKEEGETYHLTQLRLLVARRNDDKTNNKHKQMFQTLANKIDDKAGHKLEINEQKKPSEKLGDAIQNQATKRDKDVSPSPPASRSGFRLQSPGGNSRHRILLNRNIWSSQSHLIEIKRSNKLML